MTDPLPGTLITARDGYYFVVVLGLTSSGRSKGWGWDEPWIAALVSERGVSCGLNVVVKQWCLVSTFKHLVSSGQWNAVAPDEGND